MTAPPAPHRLEIARHRAMVCLPDPAEAEFARFQAEIRMRGIRIQQLEEEIAPLDAAFSAFEWTYRARLGTLQAELRSIRSQRETIEHRTIRIHARLVADPDGVLGDLFTREELNEIGEMFGIEIPPSWFAKEDAEAQHDQERTWRFHQSTGRNGAEEAEILRQMQRRRRATRPEAERLEIRRLYLNLARTCHPDLASDDLDRTRREEMMLRINDAWHRQDLDALREVERDRGGVFGWRALANWAERALWAQAECVRLDEQIAMLTARLHALRTNETYALWFNQALGDSVITQRATALRIDIATAMHRLDEAKDGFRQALRHYAASVA